MNHMSVDWSLQACCQPINLTQVKRELSGELDLILLKSILKQSDETYFYETFDD